MKRFYGLVIASTVLMMLGTSAETLSVKMLEGENWWGAANYFGSKMPFTEKSTLNVDLRKRGFANQFASMLISDKGRVVWCEDQTAITITNGTIKMVCGTTAPVLLEKGGNNLKDAFLHAANKWFPSTGRTPDLLFFSAPQYNTWIELTYNQNEKDILAYAQSMLDNGLPPGVLMIDDTWQAGYGR